MEKNQSLTIAAVVFGIVGVLHLLRAVLAWEANIAGWNVPVWLSYIIFIVAGLLAWLMYKASKE